MKNEPDELTPTTVFDEVAEEWGGTLAAEAVKARTGRDTFPTLLYFLLNLTRGKFPGFEDDHPDDHQRDAEDLDDRHIVEWGLGIDRQLEPRLGMRQPWLRGPLANQLGRVAPHLSADELLEAATVAPDRELETARDELQALIGILYSLRLTIEAMVGRSALGLAAAPHPNDLDPGMQRKLLLGWLSLRQLPGIRDNLRVMTVTAETVSPRDVHRADALGRTEEPSETDRAPTGENGEGDPPMTALAPEP